jgi:hypothetical protein
MAFSVIYNILKISKEYGSVVLFAFLILIGTFYARRFGLLVADFVLPSQAGGPTPSAVWFGIGNWCLPITEMISMMITYAGLKTVSVGIRIAKSFIPSIA